MSTNKSRAGRLVALERVAEASVETILVVEGTDPATWPKGEPGRLVEHCVIDTGISRPDRVSEDAARNQELYQAGLVL